MHDTVAHGKHYFSSRELKCHKSKRQFAVDHNAENASIFIRKKLNMREWISLFLFSLSLSLLFSDIGVFISHLSNWFKMTNWIDLHDAINSLYKFDRNKLSNKTKPVLTFFWKLFNYFTQQSLSLSRSHERVFNQLLSIRIQFNYSKLIAHT